MKIYPKASWLNKLCYKGMWGSLSMLKGGCKRVAWRYGKIIQGSIYNELHLSIGNIKKSWEWDYEPSYIWLRDRRGRSWVPPALFHSSSKKSHGQKCCCSLKISEWQNDQTWALTLQCSTELPTDCGRELIQTLVKVWGKDSIPPFLPALTTVVLNAVQLQMEI